MSRRQTVPESVTWFFLGFTLWRWHRQWTNVQKEISFIRFVFLQICTLFAFYTLYKIKRTSCCIKFKRAEPYCERFDNKVGVLGFHVNLFQKTRSTVLQQWSEMSNVALKNRVRRKVQKARPKKHFHWAAAWSYPPETSRKWQESPCSPSSI